MNFVNLTPHEIVVDVDGERIFFPSAGECRVKVSQTLSEEIDFDFEKVQPCTLKIPFFRNVYGSVEGLPEAKPNTYYIVSLMVINALKAAGIFREDVISPDSGPSAIRQDGKIVAVKGFVKG